MSINKFIQVNNSGTRELVDSSSYYYDDVSDTIYVKNFSSSNISTKYQNSILSVYNNQLYPILPNISGATLVSDGTKWESKKVVLYPNGLAGGDLTGSYPNALFNNISNITSGTLQVANGGLGQAIANLTSGSILTFVNQLSGVAPSIETGILNINSQGKWVNGLIPSSSYAQVSVFTASGIWYNQYNKKFARVICIGAGGAGGAGTTLHGGSGGGGAGISDVVVGINGVASATVTVGTVWYNGNSNVTLNANLNPVASSGIIAGGGNGMAGGDSYFGLSTDSYYVFAGGGTGGLASTGGAVAVAGGLGLTSDGGSSGAHASGVGTSSVWGFGGGSGGACGTNIAGPAGSNSMTGLSSFGYDTNNGGQIYDSTYGTWDAWRKPTNILNNLIKISGGGGGGYAAPPITTTSIRCFGGQGYDIVNINTTMTFGGGGGGGGRFLAGTYTNLDAGYVGAGGSGGKGIVVVVAW